MTYVICDYLDKVVERLIPQIAFRHPQQIFLIGGKDGAAEDRVKNTGRLERGSIRHHGLAPMDKFRPINLRPFRIGGLGSFKRSPLLPFPLFGRKVGVATLDYGPSRSPFSNHCRLVFSRKGLIIFGKTLSIFLQLVRFNGNIWPSR